MTVYVADRGPLAGPEDRWVACAYAGGAMVAATSGPTEAEARRRLAGLAAKVEGRRARP